jgi:hypothetical protein
MLKAKNPKKPIEEHTIRQVSPLLMLLKKMKKVNKVMIVVRGKTLAIFDFGVIL